MKEHSSHRNTVPGPLHEDRGATAVEYGLIVSLIAAVITGVVFTLGQQILALFQSLQWP